MFSQAYLDRFPITAAAVQSMVAGQPVVGEESVRSAAIRAELHGQPVEDAAGDSLFLSIWTQLGESEVLFVERTAQAFYYLGINDEVRNFVGSIWTAAFRRWTALQQLSFLFRLSATEGVIPELALQFAPPLFKEMRVGPEDLLAWFQQLRRSGPARQFPHHVLDCMRAYADTKPADALKLCELWLALPIDETTANVLSRIIHWIRVSAGPGAAATRLHLARMEQALAVSEEPGFRPLLLESWAFSAASPELDEATACALRAQLVLGGAEEARAWAFLLAQVVAGAPEKWGWAVRELRACASATAPVPIKYWIAIAALEGWKEAQAGNPVSRAEWEDLFFALAPLGQAEGGVWQRLEHFFVDAYQEDEPSARRLLLRLGETSGRALAGVLDAAHGSFSWFCQTLQSRGEAEATVTALCFSNVRQARLVGLRLFERCHLTTLTPATIAAADAGQIERFLLEAVVKLAEYPRMARLHICFAARVDALGGPLAEWFYDEVKTQALNTHQYREAVLAHAGDLAALRGCIEAAKQELESSAHAGSSPALKMHIPGWHRAEVMAHRHFGREVAKNVGKYSSFLQLFPTVQLLYGRNWRMLGSSGKLTASSALTKTEVNTEIPRLEYMTPEAMRQRRLLAIKRICVLDQNAAADLS